MGVYNIISSICKNKIVNKITKPLLYLLMLLFIIYFIGYFTGYFTGYLYELIFKKSLIEGNDNIVQKQCNIGSDDSPQEVLKKFNTVKNTIDGKLSKLTDIANKVQETLEPKPK